MKKILIAIILLLSILLGWFVYQNFTKIDNSQELKTSTEILPLVDNALGQSLPLKSLKIDNLEDGFLIEGVAYKSSIVDFLDEETYDSIKFLLFMLPEEFNIELYIESDLENFRVLVKTIKINNFEVNTNIELKI